MWQEMKDAMLQGAKDAINDFKMIATTWWIIGPILIFSMVMATYQVFYK